MEVQRFQTPCHKASESALYSVYTYYFTNDETDSETWKRDRCFIWGPMSQSSSPPTVALGKPHPLSGTQLLPNKEAVSLR